MGTWGHTPWTPGGQVQWKPIPSLVQVPPDRQGWDSQASRARLWLHRGPLQPGSHTQRNLEGKAVRECPWAGRQQGVRGWGEASPSGCIVADTMTARFLGTGMARGEAEWGQGARRAEAVEAIFPIHTGTSITARTGRTLVDLHVAKGPWRARRQLHPRTRAMVPTGKGNLAEFSTALEQEQPHFITHQLLYKLRQPPPQPRATLPQIILVPKLT